MVSILIASHGKFASGLKSSVEILTGMGDRLTTIDAYLDKHDYTKDIKDFIATAQRPAIIFTDLLGGSVNQQVVLAAAHQKDIYIVTQMNLAIILAVLLDSEPFSVSHLDELIAQSQVTRVKLSKQTPDEDVQDFFR
ncbi:putative pts system, iia component [Lactobacillus selangorensis]|uniref:Putative pts system, iia component n=1 Tax=Lactobacillus selangorensis TaxID=81857 RepID=A0A0R2FR04_9LACO|nr:PTS fructose transporter subunit IIA [Lactobacillus selangorensis]KRN28805.1 putative pts system, iia component [Lactobacillus selangorensis]KRN32785.1 putative pts system, iia component [Lactobacillus selangorensis]